MSGKVDNDNVWDLTKLLDVVLLPSDVQEEHLLVLVLGEDFLLDPGKRQTEMFHRIIRRVLHLLPWKVLSVLDNLLEAVDHDLLGLLQRWRELDPVLNDQAHADHGVGQEHHVVILTLDTISGLKQNKFNSKLVNSIFNRTFNLNSV